VNAAVASVDTRAAFNINTTLAAFPICPPQPKAKIELAQNTNVLVEYVNTTTGVAYTPPKPKRGSAPVASGNTATRYCFKATHAKCVSGQAAPTRSLLFVWKGGRLVRSGAKRAQAGWPHMAPLCTRTQKNATTSTRPHTRPKPSHLFQDRLRPQKVHLLQHRRPREAGPQPRDPHLPRSVFFSAVPRCGPGLGDCHKFCQQSLYVGAWLQNQLALKLCQLCSPPPPPSPHLEFHQSCAASTQRTGWTRSRPFTGPCPRRAASSSRAMPSASRTRTRTLCGSSARGCRGPRFASTFQVRGVA
jgi:hypothetical protein